MQNNESAKNYTIVIKEVLWDEDSKTEHVRYTDLPATKEEFDEYYRPINAYRRRMQEHGRCACPPKKRLLCNMDCWTCPYHCSGDCSSLEDPVQGEHYQSEDTQDLTIGDTLESGEMIDSVLEDAELLKALYAKLAELDPTERKICELVMQGKSDRKASEILGIPARTIGYKRNKAFEALREALEKYL